MTRREKILLQICVAVGLIGLCTIYLLLPSAKEKQLATEGLEAAQFEEVQIMTVVEAPGVEEALAKQKKLAQENYEYFYGKLNSYTIDGILNHLTEASGLELESMNIGNYIEINTDTLIREPEETVQEAQEELLLGCNVTLTVRGTYDQVLDFVDALEEESTCIEVISVNLYKNERNTQQEQAIEASLGLLVYGISDTIQEGEGL